MFARYNIFLLAQLVWAVPVVTLSHRSSSDSSSFSNTVATTWYTGRHSSDFTLQDLSWSKYTSVIYAFAFTTQNPKTIGLEDSDMALLPQFVQAAHDNKVKALLGIGGWGGSQYFSSAVASEKNRKAFAQAIMNVVSRYNLDGIDFDWESPNRQGIGCNIISADDSANFLSFLQTLRNYDGAQYLIFSAVVSIKPFIGSDGNPLTDASEFAKVLDYIEIMNYDVWNSWSDGVGPNAPLDDSCAPADKQAGSAVSAVKAWSNAGFPTDQIILAVAAYGNSFHVNKTSALDSLGNIKLYAPFQKSAQPAGDKWDTADGIDTCGNTNIVDGTFRLWGLIENGFLNCRGTVANGIAYGFDSCSKTSYVYNPNSQVMVSFDDATSFAAKGQYIKDVGLAGFAMWEAGGDSKDILLDAIKSASGCTA